MIQHWMTGKTVGWYELVKSTRGNKLDFVRVHQTGRVLRVDDSNTLALVKDSKGKEFVIELCELTKL